MEQILKSIVESVEEIIEDAKEVPSMTSEVSLPRQ